MRRILGRESVAPVNGSLFAVPPLLEGSLEIALRAGVSAALAPQLLEALARSLHPRDPVTGLAGAAADRWLGTNVIEPEDEAMSAQKKELKPHSEAESFGREAPESCLF